MDTKTLYYALYHSLFPRPQLKGAVWEHWSYKC